MDFIRPVMIVFIAGGVLEVICLIGFFVSENRRITQQQRSKRIHEYAAKLDAEGREECEHSHPDTHCVAMEDLIEQSDSPSVIQHDPTFTISRTSELLVANNQTIEQHLHDLHSQQQEEFYRASTGIEFGGYNTDLNLNPSTEHMVDEVHNSSMNDCGNDYSGWSDSYNDIGWDNSSFDSGFDYSGFDSFAGF